MTIWETLPDVATHMWDIRVENSDGKLVCVSRLPVAVIAKSPA